MIRPLLNSLNTRIVPIPTESQYQIITSVQPTSASMSMIFAQPRQNLNPKELSSIPTSTSLMKVHSLAGVGATSAIQTVLRSNSFNGITTTKRFTSQQHRNTSRFVLHLVRLSHSLTKSIRTASKKKPPYHPGAFSWNFLLLNFNQNLHLIALRIDKNIKALSHDIINADDVRDHLLDGVLACCSKTNYTWPIGEQVAP